MPDEVCEECGGAAHVQRRGGQNGVVACESCWIASVKAAVREMANPANNPRNGTPTACNDCNEPAVWHKTVNDRWVLLQPGTYPIGKIPAGKRWRVGGDGTAVNLRDSFPTDECRISHFDICPEKPAPTDDPFLLALWRQRRPERNTDE